MKPSADAALAQFNDEYWAPLNECKPRQFVRMLMTQLNAGIRGSPKIEWSFNKLGDDDAATTAGTRSTTSSSAVAILKRSLDREKKKVEKDSATCAAILTWYFNWAAAYLVNTKASVVAKRTEEMLAMTLKSQWQDLSVGRRR